jgi:ATP-dependent helicase/nuclease subunit A
MKERLLAVIAGLAENTVLKRALHDLRALPPCNYTEPQWQVLGAIVRLLPRATAELWSVFAAHGECDFVEIAQAANRALGSADEPTDLALALDYRIRHLLIDEFQDTSFTQFELLEKLTWGWQQGEGGKQGRTLFLVGDPMQSIYRFREAEVGLFLKVRESGIGGLRPEPLQLAVNFRSQAGVVDWVNDTFAACMPQVEDIAMGAVSHAPAVAIHDAEPGDAVTLHALFDDQPATEAGSEAATVVRLIHEARVRSPEGTIAILVRSRAVLTDIVPALKQAGLAFRAVDIDPLGTRPVVRDLLALTRALCHPADRIAWLALLRAPWCGLTLPDLHVLGSEAQFTIWECLHRSDALTRLSDDGRARAARLAGVLAVEMAERRRGGLRESVEHAWLALGGPAALHTAGALDDARIYLDHLSGREVAGTLPDAEDFQDSLAKLYAAPEPGADATLQIMTIHKAKGLEFDTVILPGLARTPRAGEKQLMVWVERPRDDADEGMDTAASGERGELLLAPVREAGTSDEPAYDAIASIAAQREALERTRLMYVAATRAKSKLHLLATLRRKPEGDAVACAVPARGSLLAALWPVFEQQVLALSAKTPFLPPQETLSESAPTMLSRLPSGWSVPLPIGAPPMEPALEAQSDEAIEFEWASPTARHIGTATHRFLQLIAQQGVDRWNASRVDEARGAIERELARLGVVQDEMNTAAARVQAALAGTLADARGRWMLGPHADAGSELRLTGLIDGEIRNVIVDRTFVDEEGTRWIVDYKTGMREGGDIEGFLDSERERYRAQLEGYARLLGGNRPVRLALYFPLLGGWREWAPANG